MEITEVRVKLVNVKNDKLRAFCSITVDNDFVIRDLKVIEGAKGAFVAMPSRKLTERCSRCGGKNHYRARFCNDCGNRLGERGNRSEGPGQKMHTDIAHPINSRCREVIQKRVLEVYQEEVQKSGEPDYKPMEFEVFDEESLADEAATELVGGGTGEAVVAGAFRAQEGYPGDADGGNGGQSDGNPPETGAQGQGESARGLAQPRAPEGRREGGRRFESPHRDGGDERRRHRGRGFRGRLEGVRGEGARGDAPRGDAARGDAPRGDGARGDAPQGDGARGGGEGGRDRGESRRGSWGGRGGRGGEGHRDSERHRPEGERSPLERTRAQESGVPHREEETVEIPDRLSDLSTRSSAPRPPAVEPDPEPEDNFGAGLFN